MLRSRGRVLSGHSWPPYATLGDRLQRQDDADLTGKSDKSARDTFLYYTGKDPSAVRYKNWKMYFAVVSDAPAGFITVPYHWTSAIRSAKVLENLPLAKASP